MKWSSYLALSILPFVAGCVEPEPAPLVVERHHYHNRTQRVYVPEPNRPVKAPAGGGGESAEGFRAVERPGSYSQ